MVNTLKFWLLAAGVPSTMVPPAEGIGSPNPFFEAALATLSATFAPSGTSVPLMSRMLVIVIVLSPDAVLDGVNTAGFAVIVAEWGTRGRSSGATNTNVPTNREPSVKDAVAVYVLPGTMNPLSDVINVKVAPDVTLSDIVPSAWFKKGDVTSVDTPIGGAPAVVCVAEPFERSMRERVRVT